MINFLIKNLRKKKDSVSNNSSDFLDDIINGKSSSSSYITNNNDVESKLNIIDEHQKRMDEIAAKKRELLNMRDYLCNSDELNYKDNHEGKTR